MKVKEVEITKEVIRSDGWWRFACGDVFDWYDNHRGDICIKKKGLEWIGMDGKNKLIEISKVWYVDLGMDHSRGSGTSG